MQHTLIQEDEKIPPFAYVVITITMLAGLLLTASGFAATPQPHPQSNDQIDPKLCQMVTKHTPDADVAYQPGVDVHGNKVAPADLPDQPQIKLPEKIQIPLTVNLAKTLNLNTSTYPYNQLGQGTESTLGTIAVEGDKITFNGQELSDAQQDKLAVLCLHPK